MSIRILGRALALLIASGMLRRLPVEIVRLTPAPESEADTWKIARTERSSIFAEPAAESVPRRLDGNLRQHGNLQEVPCRRISARKSKLLGNHMI